eukprot:4266457-Prorocentrum_lima.AAC.1
MLHVLVTFHHLANLGLMKLDLEEKVRLHEDAWARNLAPHSAHVPPPPLGLGGVAPFLGLGG